MTPILTESALKHCEQGLFDLRPQAFKDESGVAGYLGKCESCGERGTGIGISSFDGSAMTHSCLPCYWQVQR